MYARLKKKVLLPVLETSQEKKVQVVLKIGLEKNICCANLLRWRHMKERRQNLDFHWKGWQINSIFKNPDTRQTHRAGNTQPLPQHPLHWLWLFSKHIKPHRSHGEHPSRVADPRARRGRWRITRRGMEAGVCPWPVQVHGFGEANGSVLCFSSATHPSLLHPCASGSERWAGWPVKKILFWACQWEEWAAGGSGRTDKTQKATLGNNRGGKGGAGETGHYTQQNF